MFITWCRGQVTDAPSRPQEPSSGAAAAATSANHRCVTRNRPLKAQRASRHMHPFLIHGGDIEFTSTQRSSYDDACATYPISGAAQESDFSLSLPPSHRLHRLLFSAFSTSRAPTVHLGSNARKRPVKRSRLDRTHSARLDSS